MWTIALLRAATGSAKWASGRQWHEKRKMQSNCEEALPIWLKRTPLSRQRALGFRVFGFRVRFGDALGIALLTVTEVHTRKLLHLIT